MTKSSVLIAVFIFADVAWAVFNTLAFGLSRYSRSEQNDDRLFNWQKMKPWSPWLHRAVLASVAIQLVSHSLVACAVFMQLPN